jgi:rare lipoprotein A
MPRRRNTLVALVTAGILSAVGAGSYVSWSAMAEERPAAFDTKDTTAATRTINVDSLYTAKAEESTPSDSSFVVEIAPDRTISGRVSWYGPGFNGRRTASGERFDKSEMTAAHKTLPFNSLVRVVDVATGRGVLVRVNDRGPYCGGRVMDLSEGAARRLGIAGRGTATTRIEIFAPEKEAERDGRVVMTFDIEGRAVAPHGYSVKVAELGGFDEAISLQQSLQGQGYKDVYLTQVRTKGTISYEISIGLFSSDRLCGTLLAELNGHYSSAAVTHFDERAQAAAPASLAKADSADSEGL